jgi:hypothetical protein
MNGGENEVISELKKISRLLTLAHSRQVEVELSKIASTDDRKKMWILIDGKNMAKDIAHVTGVSERGVNYFLSQAVGAGFVENAPRKPPTRSIDYVPPAWLDLLKSEDEPEEVEAEEPKQLPSDDKAGPPTQKKLEVVN